MGSTNLGNVLDNINTELKATEGSVEELNDGVGAAADAVGNVATNANELAGAIDKLVELFQSAFNEAYAKISENPNVKDSETTYIINDLINKDSEAGRLLGAERLSVAGRLAVGDGVDALMNEILDMASGLINPPEDLDSFWKERVRGIYENAHSATAAPIADTAKPEVTQENIKNSLSGLIAKSVTEEIAQATEENTQANEGNTQATEENTQATNNATQAVENNTQANEDNTQANEDNTKSAEGNTQSIEENSQANENNTESIEDNTQAIDSATQAVENFSTTVEGVVDQTTSASEAIENFNDNLSDAEKEFNRLTEFLETLLATFANLSQLSRIDNYDICDTDRYEKALDALMKMAALNRQIEETKKLRNAAKRAVEKQNSANETKAPKAPKAPTAPKPDGESVTKAASTLGVEDQVKKQRELADRSITSQNKVFAEQRDHALANAKLSIAEANGLADKLKAYNEYLSILKQAIDFTDDLADKTKLINKYSSEVKARDKLKAQLEKQITEDQANKSKAYAAKIAEAEKAAKAEEASDKARSDRLKKAADDMDTFAKASIASWNKALAGLILADAKRGVAKEDGDENKLKAYDEYLGVLDKAIKGSRDLADMTKLTKLYTGELNKRNALEKQIADNRAKEEKASDVQRRREARRDAENAISEKSIDVTKAETAVKNAQNTDERIAAYNELVRAIEAKIETLRDLLESKSEAVSKEDIAKEEKKLGDAQQALRQTLDGVSSEVVAFTKHIKDKLDSIIKDSSLSTEEKAYEVGKLKSEVSSSSTNIPIYNDADLAAYKEIAEQVDATNEKLIKQSAIEDTNRQMAHDVARLEREIGEASTTGGKVAKHRELAEAYRQQAAAVEDLTKREVLLKKANDENAKAARLLAESAKSAFTNIVGMVNAATNKVIGWIRTAVSLENKGINMTVSGARTVVSSLGKVVQLFGNLANRVRSCIAAVVRFAQTATRALRTILSGVGRLIRGFGSLIGNVRRLIINFGNLSRSVRETKAFSLAFTELNSAISLAERAYNGLFNNQLLEKAFKFDSTIASITMLLGEEATNDTRKYASALQDAFGLSFTQTISDLQEITSLLKAAGLEASGISGVKLANAAQDFSAISNYLAALGMAGGDAKEVMSKLESGLKGMTQSIDDLGLSVRENDLNEFLKGTKYNGVKFSELSEANKETVRLAAIIKQFKNSFDIGNYANLLDQTYYRIAVIKSQVEEIRTIIGKIFEGIIAKILPVILLAVNSIRKALEGLAVKLNIDIKGNDIQDSLSNIADDVGNVKDEEAGVADEVNKVKNKEEDAAKAAKKFSGAAGFDELESLNTNSGDSNLNLSDLLADVGSISDALEEAAKNSGSLFDQAAEEVHAKLEELKEKWTAFVEGKLGKGVDPFFGFNWESAKKSLGNIKTNIERWWTSFSETGLTLSLKIANDAQVGRLTNDVLDFIDSLTRLAAILQEQIAPIIEDFYDKHIAKWLGATSDEIHAFVKDFKKSVNELDKNLKSGMSFKDAFKDAFDLDNPDSRFGKIAKTISDITTKIDEVGKVIDTIYRLYLRPMLNYASRILGDIWNIYLKPLLGDGGAFSIDSFLNDIINKEKKIVGILEDEQFQLEFHSNINALFDDVKTTLDNIRALAAGGFTIAGSIFSKDNGGQSLFELVSANYQKFSTDTLQPWIEETSKSVADYIEKHKQEIAGFIDMITNELFGVVDKIVELAGKFAAYNIEHPEMLKSIGDEANKVLRFISDNFDTIMAIVSYALQILMASIDGLMAGLQTVFDKFNELNTKNEGEDQSSMERIIDRVCKFIRKIWEDLGNAIANLMQWAADHEGLLNYALTAIEDISGFFSEHVVGVLTAIIGIKTVTTAAGVVDGIKGFFGEKGIGGLLNSVKGLSSTATEASSAATSISGALSSLGGTLAKAGAVGAAAAGGFALGWGIGTVLDKKFGITDKLSEATLAHNNDKMARRLEQLVLQTNSEDAKKRQEAEEALLKEFNLTLKELEPFMKKTDDGSKQLDMTKLAVDSVGTVRTELTDGRVILAKAYEDVLAEDAKLARQQLSTSEKIASGVNGIPSSVADMADDIVTSQKEAQRESLSQLEAVEKGINGIPTSVKEAIAETQSETKDAIVASLSEVKDAILKQDAKAEVEFEFNPDTSKAGMPTNIPVPVKIRALGGSVPSGNLFIANEAGNPELIGKIGRSTGTDVANRGMITEAMETAVYNGMVDAINNSRSVSSSSNNESANINISGFGIIDKTTLKKLASMLAPYLDGNKQALTV